MTLGHLASIADTTCTISLHHTATARISTSLIMITIIQVSDEQSGRILAMLQPTVATAWHDYGLHSSDFGQCPKSTDLASLTPWV